jgi:AraC family transcriptional regulator
VKRDGRNGAPAEQPGTAALLEQLRRARLQITSRPGMARHKPGWANTKRAFKDYDIHYVFRGAVEYLFQGRTLRATPGTVCFLPPGKPFIEKDIRGGRGAVFMHVHFLFALSGGIDPLRSLELPAVLRPQNPVRCRKLCLSLLESSRSLQEGNAWPHLVMHGRLLELLALLMEGGFRSRSLALDPATFGPEWLWPVLQSIEASIARADFTVENLAALSHLSVSHFTHQFTRYVGVSPKQLILQKRVERACDMLIAKDALSIKEITTRCGFTDPYHFSAQFKKATGRSPSAWRNDH